LEVRGSDNGADGQNDVVVGKRDKDKAEEKVTYGISFFRVL